MRSNIGVDQAEGLRRLLAHNKTQVITVVAAKPGMGRTSATINLAAALTCSGKDVLVLDGNYAPNNLLGRLGLHAKHDLLDVVQGKCTHGEAIQTVSGISVLHTARAMYGFLKLDLIRQQCLEDALNKVSSGVDVLLVDAAMPVLMKQLTIRPGYQQKDFWPGTRMTIVKPSLSRIEVPALSRVEGSVGHTVVSSSMASGAALLVVIDATPGGITESYALIKRLALENTHLHFEIMVNKVSDERAAMAVFENMARVARSNLAVRLEYLGYMPNDDRLKRAAQLGRSVIDAFPTAVSAKLYIEFAQKLLHLPVRQDEDEGGISCITQDLIKQLAHQRSREMVQL